MSEGYFHRVTKQTPTRFWINNPGREETAQAIAAGAISCTTNPAHGMKQIMRPEEHDYALSVADRVIKKVADDNDAADLVQQELVKPILDQFLPLYEQNPGKQGLVSIQGNPFRDEAPHHMVNEALRYRELGKNFIAKIPVTRAGLKAIEALITENVPLIATEVMGIAQACAVWELYQRVAKQCGKHPPFYVTHITGIFDDHLKNVVQRDGIRISPEVLAQAGCVVARRQYRIFKERGYPGAILGGGARGPHHFTEMVGADMHITINWAGTADKLIASDPPVVHRIDAPTPQYVMDELLEKLPDFGRAYFEDRLTVEEFAGFGPVELFRSSFIKGWDYLLKTIKDSRAKVA